ncbi:NAD(P)-dependent oxidoreductase [Occultella gossypii]|uniref:NAD(P)H-binding protein n=1 Tax=Occultella gossypii TaxID=2800820 RepID=A0ABS7SJH2_9MICO|nr:NAD(P)H-binding protein [Occultella gossypii]MBZ2199496.1 NAD(P)H-binding protein [Occultella gossypii]
MRIAVLGATGAVGSRVVVESLERGHRISAFARSRARRGELPPGRPVRLLDVADEVALRAALRGQDAVVSAIRPTTGQEHTVRHATETLLRAASHAGTRLLIVGGAGPLLVPGGAGRLAIDDERYVPRQWRTIAAASVAQLAACRDHSGSWTYLGPPANLGPGERTGRYRLGEGGQLVVAPDGSSGLSMEDLAVAALDELERPEARGGVVTVGS